MSEHQELLKGKQQLVKIGNQVGVRVPAGDGELAFILPDENHRRVVLEEGMGTVWTFELLNLPFEHIYKLHCMSNLSLMDLLVIGALLRDGPMRATDLSICLNMAPARITDRISRLDAVVSIRRNYYDRRSVIYGFTAADLCRLAARLGF